MQNVIPPMIFFDPNKIPPPQKKIRKIIFMRYRQQSVPKHCTKSIVGGVGMVIALHLGLHCGWFDII